MTPLRIAMIAPISWRTPPGGYGPWELATHTLTEALVARGHDVTLFAAAGSRTAGRLVETVPAALSEAPHLDAKVHEMLHVATAFERGPRRGAPTLGRGRHAVSRRCGWPARLAPQEGFRPPSP